MKWFIVSASTAIALLSFSAGSYASCRDDTGPKGSLVTCALDPHYQAGSQAAGPAIRPLRLL